jgi:UrcA family protein
MNIIVYNRRSFVGRMLLVGIAAGLPFAAQAGEPAAQSPGISVVVSYTDLNLSDPAGARTLYARLKRAAAKACGNRPPPIELRASMEYQDCYNLALNKAVKRVDSKQLYALHAEHARQSTVG